MKKTMILSLIVCSLVIPLTISTIAAEEQTYTDSENDVMNILLEYTDKKPNVDILEVQYSKQETLVTLTLQVKGNIENRGDIDRFLEGFEEESYVAYVFYLETSNQSYEIDYVNEKCRLFYMSEDENLTTFSSEGSTLTINFDLLSVNETFESLMVETLDFSPPYSAYFDEFSDEDTGSLEAIAMADPPEGTVGKNINFTGFAYGGSFPYNWTWDFDGDENTDSTEQNPIYAYSEAGEYNVTLTVTDNADSTVKTYTIVNITSEEPSENGDDEEESEDDETSNGDADDSGDGEEDEESDSSDYGLFLFVFIIAIIFIVGVAVIIRIIRR